MSGSMASSWLMDIMSIVNNAITSASLWFVDIFTASGMVEVYIAVLFIILAIRFILSPLLGSSRGSDRARRSGDSEEVDNG